MRLSHAGQNLSEDIYGSSHPIPFLQLLPGSILFALLIAYFPEGFPSILRANCESLVFSLTQIFLSRSLAQWGGNVPTPGAVKRAEPQYQLLRVPGNHHSLHTVQTFRNDQVLALTIVATPVCFRASRRQQGLCKGAASGLKLAPCRALSL